MRLFLNDIELDLPDKFKIARTKQVNDISSIKDRQSNFTQRIKLPRTKRNQKALELLGLVGNQSKLPYLKNKIQLFNSSGECEIYDGYGVIFNTNKNFEIAIYDGYISFSKAIENRTLTDIGLEDLNHLKNLTSVVDSWQGVTNYRYNVADYNGKMVYNSDTINLDYLIPSIKVSWLWDKIFDYFGFTYTGSVFMEDEFLSEWFTYPKSIGDSSQVVTNINTWNFTNTQAYYMDGSGLQLYKSDSFTAKINGTPIDDAYIETSTTNISGGTLEAETITIKQAGNYKIVVSGYYGISGQTGQDSEKEINFVKVLSDGTESELIADNIVYGDNFSATFYKFLEVGDKFYISGARPFNINESFTGDVDINLSIVVGNSIDFAEAFVDFSVKDFVNEIMAKYSLIPFKDKYENKINFLTLDEWLLSGEIVDWSSYNNKFINKINEKYIISKYARRNYYRYKYDGKEDDFNDGFYSVSNENLKESTTLFQSNTYSCEKGKTLLLTEYYDVFKLWDKKVKDDGSVEYKELEKRFYFQKSELVSNSLKVGSETNVQDQTVTSYYKASFDFLNWNDIVLNRYESIKSILNNSKIVDASIYLNDSDISNLDLTKTYFIRELGNYYKINKIPNYTKKGQYDVSLLRVERDFQTTSNSVPQEEIIISAFANSPIPPNSFNWSLTVLYTFNNYTPVSATVNVIQVENDVPTGVDYSTSLDVNSNSILINFPNPLGSAEGEYNVSITDDQGENSEVIRINIG